MFSTLELILAEKLIGHAERTLRYLRITTFEELYDALRSNINTTMTVTSVRKHLKAVTQREHETVQNYNTRFRYKLNETRYAAQNKYNRPALRRIAFGEEKENVIELCVKKF